MLRRPTQGDAGPRNRDLRRDVKFLTLCLRAISRKRYLVLAGNMNRSQLELPGCGLACMLACHESGYQI